MNKTTNPTAIKIINSEKSFKTQLLRMIRSYGTRVFNDIRNAKLNQSQSKKLVMYLAKWYAKDSIDKEIKKWANLRLTIVHLEGRTQFPIDIDIYKGVYRANIEHYETEYDEFLGFANKADDAINKKGFNKKYMNNIEDMLSYISEQVANMEAVNRLSSRLNKIEITKLRTMSKERAQYLIEKSLKLIFEF